MCWSEEVSWATLILGSLFNIFNIYYFRDTTVILVSIAIQWLLLMQLFEALAWRDQNCGSLNKFATNGALIANITQPLFVCMLFIIFSPVPQSYKLLALFIAFGYMCYALYILNITNEYTCLRPSKTCSHLDLYWWKNMNGFIYCVTLFSIMLLLIRPFNLAVMLSGYIALTLLLSLMFYSCAAGSIWCWFTSVAPIFFAIYYSSTKHT